MKSRWATTASKQDFGRLEPRRRTDTRSSRSIPHSPAWTMTWRFPAAAMRNRRSPEQPIAGRWTRDPAASHRDGSAIVHRARLPAPGRGRGRKTVRAASRHTQLRRASPDGGEQNQGAWVRFPLGGVVETWFDAIADTGRLRRKVCIETCFQPREGFLGNLRWGG